MAKGLHDSPKLAVLNPHPKLLPGPERLHELLRSPQDPSDTAIEFLGQDDSTRKISYQELQDLSSYWAHQLRAYDPYDRQRSTIIPILLPQCIELYIAQLSVLKAGAAFCPVAPDTPEERLKYILADVAATVIVTTVEFQAHVPATTTCRVLLIDGQGRREVDASSVKSAEVELSPDDLAYVMYTSGSTGTPKGVGVSHRAATQSLLAHDPHIPSFSRFLQFAAPTFDVSLFEIFFPLFRGKTMVGCERRRLLDDLPGVMNRLNVDAAELTPTVAGSLLRTRASAPGLRLLLTIGEMLTQPVVDEFGSAPGRGSILWGMYGPTEAAIHCTLQTSFDADMTVRNIGVPIDTVSAHIVAPAGEHGDPSGSLHVLRVGEVGELALGGHQLAKEYLNRPEQTAAAFVHHPKYGRLYRTGDKAKITENGHIECMGRISAGQVKLRGQRVELGEIEQAIGRIEGCRMAVASVISGILILFCIVDDRQLTPESIIGTSRKWLPPFMVPGDVLILQDFPRLPSGKVDKKSLEADYDAQERTTQQPATFADEVERQLADIMKGVLCRSLTPSASFSANRLDSLQAIQVSSRLKAAGFHVGGAAILQANSINNLRKVINVDRIQDSLRSEGWTSFVEATRQAACSTSLLQPLLSQVDAIVPCTAGQAAMLAETQMNPQAYCNWIKISLPHRTDISRLREWFQKLALRHAVLRSGFCHVPSVNSVYAQVYWKELQGDQVSDMEAEDKALLLESQESLLRPLQVHLSGPADKPSCNVRLHHALYDGWSLDVMLEDLRSLARGVELPPGPSFSAFASYQHSLNIQQEAAASLEYWQQYLEGAQHSTLPNFNGRITESSGLRRTDAALSVTLDDLTECAKALQVHPQVLLQSALACLLSSYYGTNDVAFGTVSSGRTVPVEDIEFVVGPCLSNLPLRHDLSQSKTLHDLIRSIHENNRSMLAHEHVPLKEIKKACGLHPGEPLFDVLFVWQESLHSSSQAQGIEITDSADSLEVKLLLEFEPRRDFVHARVTFDPSFLPTAQVNIIVKQLDQTLAHIIKSPQSLVTNATSELDVSVLSAANTQPTTPESAGDLTSAVERNAVENPDAPALSFGKLQGEGKFLFKDITYGELNARANRLARYLGSHGAGANDLVAIIMEKSVDLYTTILATLKVGAGYLPITPDTPLQRVETILQEANVAMCLTQTAMRNQLDNRFPGIRFVTMEDIRLSDYPSSNLDAEFRGADAAYAVFTSGTTGKPKGVLVTQDNLLSNLAVLSSIYPHPPGSRLLQACSQAFDVSVFEIFFAWYTGMCLCVASKDDTFHDIEAAIRAFGVTHLSLTPTVAALIDPEHVPNVRFLVTAGEALTETVRRRWIGRGLHQGYGPSETTNICTVKPNFTTNDLINNIGPPLPNTSVFVFNQTAERLVPTGGVGELCFGGSQVFRGYIGQPELTASKIIRHPYFGRLYRSGDLGRLLPDGTIMFVGRVDDQVKLRGQRIELGEINGTLLASDTVRDCVTMITQAPQSKADTLVAFWVPSKVAALSFEVVQLDEDISNTATLLVEQLKAAVPHYMVPTVLVPVSAIPQTSQGKLDRRALIRAMGDLSRSQLERLTCDREDSEPQSAMSPLEDEIASVLARVCNVSHAEVCRTSSFFRFGLDSISAISVARMLDKQDRPPVPVSAILRHSTPARLAQWMDGQDTSGPTADAKLGVDQVFSEAELTQFRAAAEAAGNEVKKILPCTPLQEAMLSSDGSLDDAAYCNTMVFEVFGNFDKLRSCWLAMIDRHEILRTCFVPTDNVRHPFAQVVLQESRPTWDMLDAGATLPDQMIAKASRDAVESFAVSASPPIRFHSITTATAKFLIFSCHHAMYDGMAISELLYEVERLYQDMDLAPVSSYESFLQEVLAADSASAMSFWKTRLEGFQPVSFPNLLEASDHSNGSHKKYRILAKELNMPLSQLERQTKELSTSLLAITQTAWAKLLSFCAGRDDVCFGTVVSGRTIAIDGLDRLVAPCFNTVPVRVDLSPASQNIHLLHTMQNLNADLLPFQLSSLRQIQSQQNLEGAPLFDTLFLLQQPSRELNKNIWSLTKDIGEMDFPLVCELIPNQRRDTLDLRLHFHHLLMSYTQSQDLAELFQSALLSCIRYPRSTVRDVGEVPATLSNVVKKAQGAQPAKTASRTTGALEKGGAWGKTELLFRKILSNLSGVPESHFSRATTIFQVGLDSISAVQVARKAKNEGLDVTSTDVMEHNTCAKLAAFVGNGGNTPVQHEQAFDLLAFQNSFRNQICAELGVYKAAVESVRPCTPLQAGLLAKFVQSQGKQYYNFLEFELDRAIEPSGYEKAWAQVVERHPMLRTGFVQVNHAQHPFAMICYRPSSLEPNFYTRAEGPLRDAAIWHAESAAAAVERTHIPPWQAELVLSGQRRLMRLGILHALYDAQSLQVLLSDFASACSGAELEPTQSIDVILSFILQRSEYESDEETTFWKSQGENMLVARFPNMQSLRSPDHDTEVVAKQASLSMNEIEARCREAGITIQAAGQAAWARLLSAYTGEPNTTFGVVFSGRTDEGLERVAFPAITTVPVSCRVQSSNKAMLAATMGTNAKLQKHQFTPLTRIQKYCDRSDEALFDTIFAYQKFSHTDAHSAPFRVIDERATADYPVSVEMEPAEDQAMVFRITFHSKTLPKEQASMILQQLDHIFSHLVEHPDGDARDLVTIAPSIYSILPAKEAVIPSRVSLLHQFVEETAAKVPTKIAFEFATCLDAAKYASQSWTYAELDRNGNRIANLIRSKGAKTGQLVAVCFDKCPEASFAMLGVLKAGCGFVALDPAAPVARKEYILQDSKAAVIVTVSALASDLHTGLEAQVLSLDTFNWSTASPQAPDLSRPIEPQDVSYCLYTSGTTGTPKGCEITHENTVQAMLSFQRLFAGHWDASSRWLQFASFHFDVSVLEQFWSWSVGIRVVSAPRDLIFEDLARAIRTLDVTHIDLTPSLARTIHPDEVPSLCRGVFITGGEQLKQEILDTWGPKAVIYNGYGPTEATIGVTMYQRVPINGKPSNIGRQFDNVGSFVLKPGTETPVLRGGVGELCVSGKLVGKGYLNRRELTSQRFPTLQQYIERVYRTGDLVRLLHDGCFDFLGRADDQVKLRGQRLEIGEVNSIIKEAAESTIDVATLVVKHERQGTDQLVSFIARTSVPGSKIDATVDDNGVELVPRVRSACKARLPKYMVPTYIVPLTVLPLSANNKADGKKLKDLFLNLSTEALRQLSDTNHTTDGGLSHIEQSIATVLKSLPTVEAEVLTGSSTIFELGLDSITVLGFSHALKKAGFDNASPALIMRNATLSGLATVLGQNTQYTSSLDVSVLSARQIIAAFALRWKGTIASALHQQPDDIEAVAPCTPLQQGILSRSLRSGSHLYFASFHFDLEPGVDMRRLKSAWQEVFEAVQILRTCFAPTNDGYAQVALRPHAIPWNEDVLPAEAKINESLEERHQDWTKNNEEVLGRSFEVIATKSETRTIMTLHIFHALYDGNSLHTLLEKVALAYEGVQNLDYGPAFQDILPYGPLRNKADARDFWTSRLSGAASAGLPKLGSSCSSETVSAVSELRFGHTLKACARELKVTSQAIVQACWIATLQQAAQGPVTVGTVISGRSFEYPGVENTIGPLFNTIPFHIALSATDSWADVVRRCHDFNTAALSYQHTPLRDIVKWCARSKNDSMFDTLFVFQRQYQSHLQHRPLWKPVESKPEADYPLAFEAEEAANGALKLTVVAQGSLCDQESSNNLLRAFKTALEALLSNLGERLDKTFNLPSAAASRGDSQVNGHVEEKRKGSTTAFEWTPQAMCVRDEIAKLAGEDASSITERTSILELGLDSIDAMKLASRLKKNVISLPVSVIMRSLTVEKMVQSLSYTGKPTDPHTGHDTVADIEQRLRTHLASNDYDLANVERVLPATPLQEGMVAEMLSSDFERYFNHDVLQLSSYVDKVSLKQAWQTIVDKNPIVRTFFVEVDHPDLDLAFAQVVEKPSAVAWSETEIGGDADVDAAIQQAVARAKQGKGQQSLVQLTYCKIPGSTDKLILSIAHALYDGWSLGLLHDDVRKAYNNERTQRPGYDGYLEGIMKASDPAAASYWRNVLAGATATQMPTRELQEPGSSKIVHRKEIVSRIDVVGVRNFCKSKGITLQAVGQLCWSLVLASLTHQLDVTFGVVLSARDSPEANKILFPTMNTIAVRSILHGTRSEMLQSAQQYINETREYQHYPLRKAQAFVNLNGKSLFDSLFIYQKQPEVSNAGTERLYNSVGGSSDVEYPVCVEMEQVENDLTWRTACANSTLDEADAERLLRQVDAVLQEMINRPDRPTFEVKEDEIVICGLRPFRVASTAPNHQSVEPNNAADVQISDGSWTTTEAVLRDVLSSLSDVPQHLVSRGTTIFHLGIDSISAIKVSSLLRKKNLRISVSAILKAGTVAEIAKIIDEQPRATERPANFPDEVIEQALKALDMDACLSKTSLKSRDVQRVLPATAGQVYMLSTWQNSRGALFHPEFRYRLKGPCSVDQLCSAWNTLVDSNPMLRCSLVATGRSDIPFVQVFHHDANGRFHMLDNNQSKEMSLAAHQQPFAALSVAHADDGYELRLRIHHALYDAVSLSSIWQQLESLCNAGPYNNFSVKPFVEVIAASVPQSARSARQSFWTDYLRSFEPHHIARMEHHDNAARTTLFQPAVLPSATLESHARKEGLSIQALFLAVYAKVHARLSRTPRDQDVVFGIYLANRSHSIEGLADVPAPTLNLVPLRVISPLSTKLTARARQIQDDLRSIGTLENSCVGLWEIHAWTGVKMDAFINFIKLPEADQVDDDPVRESGERVKIEEVLDHDQRAQDQAAGMEKDSAEHDELNDNAVREVYLPSVDIEATVRNGALDMGVFTPASMLSSEEAGDVISRFKKELEELA